MAFLYVSNPSTKMKATKATIILALVAFAAASPFPRTLIKKFPERFVGRTEASRGEFPYIVQIKRGSHYCAGSIVNANWILTAAHCSAASISGYTVVAGEHNLSQNEGSEQYRTVSQIIRHPSYNANTLANDIAVWKINSSFTFNNYVQASSLGSIVPSGDVVLAGWSWAGILTNVLMKATIPMVSDISCKNFYGQSEIVPGMICAGTGDRESCQGDSGGPLVTGSTQVGVGSWGYGCVFDGYPAVYASVPFYRSWILSNTA